MTRLLSLVVGAALLTGCPSFPDPVKPGGDGGGPDTARVDSNKPSPDSSYPDLPPPDQPLKPDGPPIKPDVPFVPDADTKYGNGAPCTTDGHCATNHCVDFFCCDKACGKKCEACNLPMLEGTCTKAPDGQDPRHDCTASMKSSCGDDGACDGKGGCRKWGTGTVCLPGKCSSGYKVTGMMACDGKGGCTIPAPDVACHPFDCNSKSNTCFVSCNSSNEGSTCQGYYGCNTSTNKCYTSCTKDEHCNGSGECSNPKCVKD